MKALEEKVRQAIEEIAGRYRQLGYSVEQGSSLGPGLEADLVARRGSETVIIEAKATGLPASTDLRRLAEVAQQRGWRFVVAAVDSRSVEEVEVKSATEIGAKLAEARQLGSASTAFPLLAWSVFEAAARNALARHNERFPGVTPPRALVQQLAAMGLLDTTEERELMALADYRSRIAHGFWPTGSTPNGSVVPDFERVLGIAERLVSEDDSRGQASAS